MSNVPIPSNETKDLQSADCLMLLFKNKYFVYIIRISGGREGRPTIGDCNSEARLSWAIVSSPIHNLTCACARAYRIERGGGGNEASPTPQPFFVLLNFKENGWQF